MTNHNVSIAHVRPNTDALSTGKAMSAAEDLPVADVAPIAEAPSNAFARRAATDFAGLLGGPAGQSVQPLRDARGTGAVRVGGIVVTARLDCTAAEAFGAHPYCGPANRCLSCSHTCLPEKPLDALLDAAGGGAHTAVQLNIASGLG